MSGRGGLLAIAAAAVAAAACGDGQHKELRQLSDAVTVEPGALDFGDVALGREQATEFLLRNDGIVATTVDMVPGSAAVPDFQVAGLPAKLRPGESVKLKAVFKPAALGVRNRTLDLTTPFSGTDSRVGLRGNAVRGLATISDTVIDFGNVVMNESATATLSLTNNDGKAQTDVTIEGTTGADAASFHYSPDGKIDLAADQSLTVQIDFLPTRLGPFDAALVIVPCPTCQPRPIELKGSGVERLIAVDPATLDFGQVRLGSHKDLTFTVENTSKKAVALQGIQVPAQDFTFQIAGNPPFPINLPPGGSVSGTARFAPTSLGGQQAHVLFIASDGAPATLDATGSGYGPVLSAKPVPFDIGPTAIGTTRTKKLVLTNVGLDPTQADPLIITGITLQAANPQAWSFSAPGTPWRLGEPGATGQMVIGYSPAVAGPDNATLTISTNDALHPTTTVQLTARARDLAPCQVRILPNNPVDFGVAKLFDQTVQGFELVNDGPDDCIFGDPEIISGGPAFYWPGNVAPVGRQIAPGGRMSVRVAFNPEAEVQYTGQVAFYMSNKALQTVLVDLRGTGDGGCFFITPGAVDFGGTQLGCNIANQSAFLTNQCKGPVTVTDVKLTPGHFAIVAMPQLPFTVGRNQQVPVTMAYDTSTIGDDVAALQVTASTRPDPYQVGVLGGVLQTTNVVDQWDQSTPKVDLLMVIDNSGSMAEEQRALAANLDHLWNRIALANADFHIAITSTGMQAYTSGFTQCSGGASGGEAGRFFPVDGSRPRLLTPSTPNVRSALFANTAVGTCHWDERFLEPAVAALTPPLSTSTKAPGTPFPADGNAGFLRDDARLAILAVSDADDANDEVSPRPVSEYVARIAATKHGALDLVSFAGIVPLRLCSTAEGVGVRFKEIADAFHGNLYDVCDLSNFGALLDNALGGLLLPLTSFQLSAMPRDPQAIVVTVNGAVVTTWSYDAPNNRIVFPASAVPPAGSHITATYQAACK
ncbi:MAG: choice-of-anchor D domain-containing protein [Myxococcales bacterium]